MTNEEILNILKADTGAMLSTLLGAHPANATANLNPEQARAFIRRIFEKTPMLEASRKVIMTSRTVNIDKVNVQNRLLRAKPEGTANALVNAISFNQLTLNANFMQLPIEISNETLAFNLERESFEDTVVELITKILARDLSELFWCGQTAAVTATTTNAANTVNTATATTLVVTATAAFPYKGTLIIGTERVNYDGKTATSFLRCDRGQDGTTAAAYATATSVAFDNSTTSALAIMNGWLYYIRNGYTNDKAGTVIDGSAINGDSSGYGAGAISALHFRKSIASMPPRYLAAMGQNLKFIMHPLQRFAWEDWLVRNRTLVLGDRALQGNTVDPYGFGIFEDPTFPTNAMLFADPANMVTGVVGGHDIRVSRDTTSKDVISKGVRYYQVDFWADAGVERADACVLTDNLIDPTTE